MNLDKALENAKEWCKNNLYKYVFKEDNLDYSIFHYDLENPSIGTDMCFDPDEKGLIHVSTEKLDWYRKREEYYKNEKYKPREPIEVDEESMFVHEITEFLIFSRPELLKNLDYFLMAHNRAREIENINRKERGLKDWPEY